MTLTVWSFVIFALFSGCLCQCNPNGTDNAPTQKKVFPRNFLFGAATSAYQVEGAWNVSDKSQSIWDVFTHNNGVKDNSTGDDACKSYYNYKCDYAMLKYLGVDFYRFSISWPRILPYGYSNYISQEGISYYNRLIDELAKNSIEPVITMYHWDLPQCLQDLGGWANPLVAQWMEDYARVLFENFGKRVKIWITMNEPKLALAGYGKARFAPGLKDGHGTTEYIASKNMIMAHARVWRLYDKEYRSEQNGLVGITLSSDYDEPMTDSPDDIQAAKDAHDFNIGLYAHPIFSSLGGFPPRVKQLVAEKSKQQGYPRSRLPDFTDEEIEYCKGTSDFFGMNHYSTQYWTRRTYKPGKDIPSVEDDLGAKGSFLNYPMTASSHIAVIPHGMRGALKLVKDLYGNPPVLITENGAATDEDLYDFKRIDYYTKYINNILDAINEDKMDIFGYTAWSLMDNFEFGSGYKPRFGLFKVDYQSYNKKRQARLSADWYRNLIATKTLDPYYKPKFVNAEFCV